MCPVSRDRLAQLESLLRDAVCRGDDDLMTEVLGDIFHEFPEIDKEKPASPLPLAGQLPNARTHIP